MLHGYNIFMLWISHVFYMNTDYGCGRKSHDINRLLLFIAQSEIAVKVRCSRKLYGNNNCYCCPIAASGGLLQRSTGTNKVTFIVPPGYYLLLAFSCLYICLYCALSAFIVLCCHLDFCDTFLCDCTYNCLAEGYESWCVLLYQSDLTSCNAWILLIVKEILFVLSC